MLDLRAVGLAPKHRQSRRRRVPGNADLSVIEQLWLRRLMQRWVEIEHPPARTFNQTLRAVRMASRALAERPGGGQDPTALRFTGMSAVVATIWSQTSPGGTPYATNTAGNWHAVWFKLLDFGGRAGLLDDLGGSFVRDRGSHPHPHRRRGRDNEDEAGKAVPESVIAQLDAQLGSLGDGPVYGYGNTAITRQDLRVMYQTAYVLLRDTGRRPTEIASLTRDCLEHDRGDVSLIWDNHKSRRLRRRLPITAGTAQAVRAWQERRGHLVVPARGEKFFFPALTRDSPHPHLGSAAISGAIRIWADGLPELLCEDFDAAGNRIPFDRSRIYPYAFRHSFAQRHADAGTPTDVLRELMDHRSIETTAGYYTVSMKRRRHAVAALSAHVVDRHGAPAACTTSAYQLRSVAVPYGGCTEPSNIKAGGRACPIRFQCAGCGFYRPDPSYLTAIEQHINDLRADWETAHAMDAAAFVLTAMTEEINAYHAVAATMRTRLAELPAPERAGIEQAATVLRKIRAAGATTALPLTVINHSTGTDRRDPG
ncbi:MAG: tyrosine-type recombinase/integrase [Pseudonocardiaceae bacterium]